MRNVAVAQPAEKSFEAGLGIRKAVGTGSPLNQQRAIKVGFADIDTQDDHRCLLNYQRWRSTSLTRAGSCTMATPSIPYGQPPLPRSVHLSSGRARSPRARRCHRCGGPSLRPGRRKNPAAHHNRITFATRSSGTPSACQRLTDRPLTRRDDQAPGRTARMRSR